MEAFSPRPVRALELDDGSHLSACSGIAAVGSYVYVAPDDENFLAVFSGDGPGRRMRLFAGELPEEENERKRLKADIECLTVAGGALLALGSGSTERRRRAARWPLDDSGALVGEVPEVIDLSPLYRELDAHFAELNVEGCACIGDWLLLAQRGNGRDLANAVVTVALSDALRGRGPAREVRRYDLGEIDGVPLAFTDLAPLGDGRIAFTAAAEDTDDPYLDGPTKGSALGLMDTGGDVVDLVRIGGTRKVEGLTLAPGGETLLVVDDPDDSATPSKLHSLPLPGSWRN